LATSMFYIFGHASLNAVQLWKKLAYYIYI
jgi:hypothetical protein